MVSWPGFRSWLCVGIAFESDAGNEEWELVSQTVPGNQIRPSDVENTLISMP